MHQSTLEATVEEFREVVDINLTGEFIMCRAVGRIMIERGIKGSIINMASMSGTIVNIPQWQVSYLSLIHILMIRTPCFFVMVRRVSETSGV